MGQGPEFVAGALESGSLADDVGEKLFGIDAMGGVVRASIDATGFFQIGAEIATGGFLFDGGFFAAGVIGIVGHDFEWMKVDVAVRAIARAETAANAPIFDDDFERVASANGADGTTDHAERIAALAAAGGD